MSVAGVAPSGARFTPVHDDRSPGASAAARGELGAGGEAPLVLLVEDEAEVAGLVEEALTDAGLDVQVALGDRAALDALETDAGRYQVLLTDINLGLGVTGFDIARQARRLNRAIKVVYITGHAAHLGRFGVEGSVMFPKPFDPHELAERVKALAS